MARRAKRDRAAKKFSSRMQTSLLFVYIVGILLLFVMIGRIYYLQRDKGETYEKKVLSQQTYVSNIIPYQRGAILDRNEIVLAKSEKIYNLVFDPKMILSEEEYREPTLNAVNSVFGLSFEEMNQLLEERPEARYVVMQKEIEYDLVEQFKELMSLKDKDGKEKTEEEKKISKNIKGIWFEEDYKRVYPLKTTACDVVGFTNSKGAAGLGGIEDYYNEQLTGTSGREYGYFDADLNLERTVKPPVAGNTVVSTIDANIQQIVEKHLDQFAKDQGSKEAAALVMNVNTGEILAMASGKPYDLNNPWDLSSFYKKNELNKMSDKEKENALFSLWRNFCISDNYEPGSTFKPFTISAGLEEAIVNKNTSFTCNGVVNAAGTPIHCNATHGKLSLAESLMKSCNASMMSIGRMLGRTRFDMYQRLFGFGSVTGIDLPGESPGDIFTEEELNVTELDTCSFGQGHTVNMVQIAAGISSLINGGCYYQPHVVSAIRNENNAVIKNIEPVMIRRTVSEQTSSLIREFLYETIEEGTATSAKIPGYQLGGKTGTAEKHPRKKSGYLVSFIGFAPADDPQYLCYVVIDEPKTETRAEQAHATFAIGVWKNIMEEILPFLNVYQTEDTRSNGTPDNGQQASPTPEPSPSVSPTPPAEEN